MTPVQYGYGGSAVRVLGTGSETRSALDKIEAAGIDHIGIGDHISFYAGFGYDGRTRWRRPSVLALRFYA